MIVTANVNTLHPREAASVQNNWLGLCCSAKLHRLETQLHDLGAHIVGVQESRISHYAITSLGQLLLKQAHMVFSYGLIYP